MEPIVSREQIARLAEPAARDFVRYGKSPKDPYPDGTDAHAAYEASFARFELAYSACVDCVGSA